MFTAAQFWGLRNAACLVKPASDKYLARFCETHTVWTSFFDKCDPVISQCPAVNKHRRGIRTGRPLDHRAHRSNMDENRFSLDTMGDIYTHNVIFKVHMCS